MLIIIKVKIVRYMATEQNSPPIEEKQYEDKYSVHLSIGDKKTLAELVKRYVLDLVEAHETGKESVQAVVYATEKQIAALEKEKLDLRVGENQSEIGRARQQEVSREDRFKGGEVPPKGLGIKK